MKKQSNLHDEKKNYHINYEEALNTPQCEAVFFKEGTLLVIAGAGSGKTRTLTYRVARLVEDGILPSSILLLTFTRKAAFEMLDRASKLLDYRCEKVSGGTFHSFANIILKKYSSKIGFENGFTILDRSDSESLIGLIRKEHQSALKSAKLPRKRTLANIISKAVNKGITIEDVVFEDFPHFSINLEEIIKINSEYRTRKIEHNFFDFDDLLVYLHLLLKEHTHIREKISSSYQYILVDEYQDTNWLQAEILYLLSSINKNVMAVGDDSQSIYAFRGANFRNIMDFPKIYPGTEIINLEENYRSIQPVLNLTNLILEKAEEKYDKKLFTHKKGDNLPVLVDSGYENSQSRFVTEKILELRNSGIPLNQMAVLFRASFHSFDLEIELTREQIPFIKVGGFKFVESSHIKDVLAHLKVVLNPQDRISWYRIFLLIKKVGPKTAQSIFEKIQTENTGFTGLLTVKHKSINNPGFIRLQDLFSLMDSKVMTIAEMGQAIINYYTPILTEKHDDHPRRTKDLEHLVTIMDRYNNLHHFLDDMALEPPNTSRDNTFATDNSDQDRLVLSTIHSAKGLEWHTVFIIWALDGRFPSIHAINSQEELEEELRLMYVASTRAKNNLFFTYPSNIYDRSSGMTLYRPSRFIDMIPDDVLEKYNYSPW